MDTTPTDPRHNYNLDPRGDAYIPPGAITTADEYEPGTLLTNAVRVGWRSGFRSYPDDESPMSAVATFFSRILGG